VNEEKKVSFRIGTDPILTQKTYWNTESYWTDNILWVHFGRVKRNLPLLRKTLDITIRNSSKRMILPIKNN